MSAALGPGSWPGSRPGSRRRFRRDRSGSAALEFAIVLPLLLALVFSIFEAGWMMTRTMLLDRALDITIRSVRTGKDAPRNQMEMKRAVCGHMIIVPDCEASMLIEMRGVASASDFPTSAASCVDRGETIQPSVGFGTGGGGSLILVRACLVTDPLAPFIGLGLAMPKDSKGGYSIVSISAFMNEPGV